MLPLDDDEIEVPLPPGPPPGPPPPPPPPPVDLPLERIVSGAAPPIQYRALAELAKDTSLPRLLPSIVYSYKPALMLALEQGSDGTWHKAMIRPPTATTRAPFAGVGTVPAVHRLLECGWDREAPILLNARRPLFRLLAEDNDPAFTYELAGESKDGDGAAFSRSVLRAAAAGALAHAGYGTDPRLRGAAQRMRQRIQGFLDSPLADDPWVKHEGKQVLIADAAPPSLHFLIMLAFMPGFRLEHDEFVDLLFKYLTRPLPRHEPVQFAGTRAVPAPGLVLGDPLPTRQAADADIPFTLLWLELMARLGLLERHEPWKRQFERLLDDRDRDLLWRPGKSQTITSARPAVWPFSALGKPGEEGAALEVTFRLGLIGRIAGRELHFV